MPGKTPLEQAADDYPRLKDSIGKFAFKQSDPASPDDRRGLEFYPQGEEYSFDKSKPAIEVFNGKDVKSKDIAGDIVSHYLAQGNDPVVTQAYNNFRDNLTDDQQHRLNFQYQSAKKDGEDRPYYQWLQASGLPAAFRGYAFQQWDDGDMVYTDAQKKSFDNLNQYLKQPSPATRGSDILKGIQQAGALFGEPLAAVTSPTASVASPVASTVSPLLAQRPIAQIDPASSQSPGAGLSPTGAMIAVGLGQATHMAKGIWDMIGAPRQKMIYTQQFMNKSNPTEDDYAQAAMVQKHSEDLVIGATGALALDGAIKGSMSSLDPSMLNAGRGGSVPRTQRYQNMVDKLPDVIDKMQPGPVRDMLQGNLDNAKAALVRSNADVRVKPRNPNLTSGANGGEDGDGTVIAFPARAVNDNKTVNLSTDHKASLDETFSDLWNEVGHNPTAMKYMIDHDLIQRPFDATMHDTHSVSSINKAQTDYYHNKLNDLTKDPTALMAPSQLKAYHDHKMEEAGGRIEESKAALYDLINQNPHVEGAKIRIEHYTQEAKKLTDQNVPLNDTRFSVLKGLLKKAKDDLAHHSKTPPIKPPEF